MNKLIHGINLCKKLKNLSYHESIDDLMIYVDEINTLIKNKQGHLLINNFDSRGLSTLILELSKIFKHNKVIDKRAFQKLIHPELSNNLQECMLHKINEFNSQDLANTIYAFGILGIKPDKKFLSTWQVHAEKQISESKFNSQDLANTIYAFGILGIKSNDKFLSTWQVHAEKQMNESKFNSQGLANTIYAFGILGIKPDKKFLSSCQVHAEKQINESKFNSQELANTIYAFGILGIKPDKKFLSTWQVHAEKQINESKFNSQELANTIYAFGRLGIKPDKKFLSSWQVHAEKQINESKFNSQELANTIYAFGILGIKPDKKFLSSWQVHAEKQINESKFNSQELANTIYAFGILGIKPDKKFLSTWQVHAEKQINESKFNSQNLANASYSFLLLYHDTSKLSDTLITSINKIDLDTIANSEILQFYITYSQMSQRQKDLLHTNVKEFISTINFNQNDYKTSKLELKIKKILKDLNEDFIHGYYVDALKTQVDFYLPGKNLVIQVDGPWHYYSNSELNSSTELNSYLLKNSGYNLERLSYQDIDKSSDLKNMLQSKIKVYEPKKDISINNSVNIKSLVPDSISQETLNTKKSMSYENKLDSTAILVKDPSTQSNRNRKRHRTKTKENNIGVDLIQKHGQHGLKKRLTIYYNYCYCQLM